MSKLTKRSLIKKSEDTAAEWLDRLPALGRDEKKLFELMARVYQEYLAVGANVRDLAIKHDVPVDIVLSWARQGKWNDRKEEFRQELLLNLEVDYAEFVRDKRTGTAQAILDALGPKIQTLAEGLESAVANEDSVTVRRYAEAIKAISDVVTKITGLDAPLPASERPAPQENDKGSGKQPWLNINAQGPLTIGPAVPEKPAIDVTSEEEHDNEET